MPRTLTFLHTSPVLIPTFAALIKERAPDIPIEHIVDESFIQEARETGVTPALTERIHGVILDGRRCRPLHRPAHTRFK